MKSNYSILGVNIVTEDEIQNSSVTHVYRHDNIFYELRKEGGSNNKPDTGFEVWIYKGKRYQFGKLSSETNLTLTEAKDFVVSHIEANSNAAKFDDRERCLRCNGSGRVQRIACDDPDIKDACSACRGEGAVDSWKNSEYLSRTRQYPVNN